MGLRHDAAVRRGTCCLHYVGLARGPRSRVVRARYRLAGGEVAYGYRGRGSGGVRRYRRGNAVQARAPHVPHRHGGQLGVAGNYDVGIGYLELGAARELARLSLHHRVDDGTSGHRRRDQYQRRYQRRDPALALRESPKYIPHVLSPGNWRGSPFYRFTRLGFAK